MQFCASVLGFVPVKRFYKYLLKRCFGSFLAQEIDLSDLDVQLFRGIVCLQNLALDPNALNALHGFDLSVVDGKIGKLKMSIPWRNLLHERTKLHDRRCRRVMSELLWLALEAWHPWDTSSFRSQLRQFLQT